MQSFSQLPTFSYIFIFYIYLISSVMTARWRGIFCEKVCKNVEKYAECVAKYEKIYRNIQNCE